MKKKSEKKLALTLYRAGVQHELEPLLHAAPFELCGVQIAVMDRVREVAPPEL